VCIKSGTFYIDGGFRPCIAKSGRKWAYLIYIRANKIRCKKIRNQKTGVPKPIVGMKQYTIQDLAKAFLKKKTCYGTQRKPMSKKAESILTEILTKGIVL